MRADEDPGPKPRSTGEAASPGSPVRVLFVYDHLGYPGGATHGLTRYCLDVFPRIDPEVACLSACFLRGEHPAAERLRAAGVPVTFLDRSRWDPRALPDVVRKIREVGAGVVHASGQKGVLVGRTAARIAGARVLVHLHDMTPPRPLVRLLLRATSRWTTKAVGVSRAVADYATGPDGIQSGPVSVLHNGFDPDAFVLPKGSDPSEWRALHGFEAKDRLVGVIGRLAPEKGQAHLLGLWPRIVGQFPSARLAVIGAGPLASTLRRQAVELGVSDSVRFLGHQQDMARVLAALDLVVLPSHNEGLSFVVLEAMAAGRPVVANRVGGVPEVLDDGACGILVDPEDDIALGDAILAVLKEPGRTATLRRRARDRTAHFTLDRHVAELERLYLQLGRVSDAQVAG